MKAYFLSLGAGAEEALPALLTAFGCGAAKQPASVALLRVLGADPDSLTDRLLGDLRACHAFFAGMDAFAFFHTEWKSSVWRPVLPGREVLVKDERSSLLLQALRGDGVPFSFRTDREAAEWSVTALLSELSGAEAAEGKTGGDPIPAGPAAEEAGKTAGAGKASAVEQAAAVEQAVGTGAGKTETAEQAAATLSPLRDFLAQMDADAAAGEDVRVLLLCDLTEGYGTGLALGLLRFLRARYRENENAPFLGLVGQGRAFGAAAEEGARQIRETLFALRDRNLVRASEERDTAGADAFWLLGMPASLRTGKDSALLLDWAAARVLGEAWSSPARPGAGLHTRETPLVINLQALDQEAKPAAAFLRGSCWCLSDLFPALRSYLEHPALLRSLAPASRGGLFRRLFRDAESGAAGLALLDRTMRALLLQALRLLQSLPPLMKDAALTGGAWDRAVRACGRAVTVASEYDVRRREAEESGVDRVQPVHRASLADTAEEEALHQLDRLAADLAAAGRQREEIFTQLGGYGARMALEDCLAKCRVAEVSAREKLIQMPAGTPEERLALGLQERRTRMLKAAVERCQRDLTEAKRWENICRPGTLRPEAPFAGEALDPALAGQAFTMLTGEEPAAGEAAKALRDGLGGLISGYALNDAKTLLKNLLTAIRRPEEQAPLRSLLAGVFSVCGVEVSGLRFASAAQLPSLPLLPDLTEEGRFFTLSAAPERILSSAPEDETALRRGLLALMLLREYRRRGLMEAALELIPLRREDSPLTEVYLSSRNAERAELCVLSGGPAEAPRKLPLAVLFPGGGLEPARPQPAKRDLIPAFAFWIDRETLRPGDPCAYLSEADRQILTQQLTRLRAGLKDPRSHGMQDFLSDWHRDIQQVPRRTEAAGSLRRRLRVACGLARLPLWQKELQRIPSFYEFSLTEDPVCGALLGDGHGEAASCDIREDVIYAFRGTPVAREHPRRLLDSTQAPGEERMLASLDTECDILCHSSDDYHEALAAGLRELRLRCPGADADALEVLEELEKEAGEPIREAVTELTWPWDTHSTSVMTILTECLGKELAGPALRAFSDRLALFPARGGEILGDLMLSGMCQVSRESPKAGPPEDGGEGSTLPAGMEAAGPAGFTAAGGTPGYAQAGEAAGFTAAGGTPGYAPAGASGIPGESAAGQAAPEGTENRGAQVRPDAVLPPLSPDFARALCRSPRGQSLLSPRFLSCEAEEASLRVTLALEGAFTLKLKREYAPEEIRSFYAHDLPTLALWPSLPFPPESWHAYFSYAHAGADFRFVALSRTEEKELEGQAPRFAACQEEYPLGYLVFWQEEALGAVPNLLPAPEIPVSGGWTACVDFGAAASSVVFTDGQARWPLQGAVTVRTLLRSPAATENALWREFLPAVPVSPLLPGALRLFRNAPGEEDLPLRDGAILMSSSLRDVLEAPAETLYTDLKWNAEKGRAARLYLHQLMLMAALQARCGGAASLGWRTALPDAMPPEGRERLAQMVASLAETVSRESGLPLPEKAPPAAFAAESSALGAYFRFCAPDQARGGFLTLDQGADTADLSLFLRGREEAVRSCQLPLGLHHMLLPALLRKPGILREDFGFVEDEGFQRDLTDLQALLEKARMDSAALRQARYGLDALLADRLPLLLDALFRRRAGGEPGRVGALYLLYESCLMMLSGLLLMQIAGDSLRNDELPEAMTMFLAGRGSLLTESLSLPAKTSLWKMFTMFRNPRVQSLQLVFSAEKKLELPVGLSLLTPGAALPRAAQEPAATAVRPEELMPEFLLRFRREFPAEAALLFPGVYANDYYAPFTPYGQQLLAQAVQAAFGGQAPGRPFPALVACLNHLLDMIQEGMP